VKPSDPSSSFVTRHRFVVLFVALLVFFVLVPVLHQVHEKLDPAAPPIFEGILFIVVLAGVVVSLSANRTSKLLALGLGLPAAGLVLVHSFGASVGVAVVRQVIGIAFLGYAIIVIFLYILASRRVSTNTVFASLCIYLLLGVVWALGYSLIEHFDLRAFLSTSSTEQSRPLMQIGTGKSTAVLYFSFVTLTTLGYGDIVPVSPIARTLASLEAITGQLFLAVLVARLVGLHIAESLEQKQGDAAEPTRRPDG